MPCAHVGLLLEMRAPTLSVIGSMLHPSTPLRNLNLPPLNVCDRRKMATRALWSILPVPILLAGAVPERGDPVLGTHSRLQLSR